MTPELAGLFPPDVWDPDDLGRSGRRREGDARQGKKDLIATTPDAPEVKNGGKRE